ncbi:MAG: cobalamin biosynthesis protein CobW [Lachnospiraceae bacterium]|nr:cobalamin biosynthesis protein CobW [Lachnospiraceae bacterium]
MTKVDIFSGFLGAGKTTLIKKLIAEAFKGEKLVLIENEFGEIGIDGGFLKDSGIEITEMNSGCICCTLVGDFGEALKKVMKQFTPDRILIEPSGVGKLSDVIKAIQDVAGEAGITVNNFIAVVDAGKAKMYMKNFGEFFNNQIEYAKTIILSRTQNVSQAKLEETIGLIREHNDKAVLITTPWDELTGEAILKAMEEKSNFEEELLEAAGICPECGHHHEHGEECHHDHHHDHDEDEHEHHHHDHDEDEHEHHHHDHDEDELEHHHHDHDEDEHEHHHHDHDEECGCGHHHGHEGHHHADEVFASVGIETGRKYTEEEISERLEKLDSSAYGVILRAKGIVASTEGEWIHFDYTPGEAEVRRGSNDVIGRICVIGSQVKEDMIRELFK